MLSDLDRDRLAIICDERDRGMAMRGGQLPPLGTKRDSTTEMLYVVLMRIFGFYLVQAVFANWTTKNCNDLLWNRPRTTIEDQLRAHIKTVNVDWAVSFPEEAECISPVFVKGYREHHAHIEVASDSNKTFAAKFLAAICCRTCWREEDRSLDRISRFWMKIGLKSKKPKMPINWRPESVPPGDIVTQPGTKIVCNAPDDNKHTYHIKIVKINEIFVL